MPTRVVSVAEIFHADHPEGNASPDDPNLSEGLLQQLMDQFGSVGIRPDAPHKFANGDAVPMEIDGKRIEGRVRIASGNGRSLYVAHQGGGTALLYEGNGFHELTTRRLVKVMPLTTEQLN